MPKERDIVNAIKDELSRRGVLVMKHHGTIYAVKGHSDLYGILPPSGRAFFLEVKRPGKNMTPVQEAFLGRVAALGAVTGLVRSVSDAVAVLTPFLVDNSA